MSSQGLTDRRSTTADDYEPLNSSPVKSDVRQHGGSQRNRTRAQNHGPGMSVCCTPCSAVLSPEAPPPSLRVRPRASEALIASRLGSGRFDIRSSNPYRIFRLRADRRMKVPCSFDIETNAGNLLYRRGAQRRRISATSHNLGKESSTSTSTLSVAVQGEETILTDVLSRGEPKPPNVRSNAPCVNLICT